MLAVAACTRLEHHTIGGYTSGQLAAVTQAARDECAALRGPGNLPPHEFTTDGCSLFLDGTWTRCCVDHDKKYWCGGTAEQRSQADTVFRGCVVTESSTLWGGLMWLGVRAGGAPWMPFWFRWGYGWPWPKPYDAAKPSSAGLDPAATRDRLTLPLPPPTVGLSDPLPGRR